MDPDQTAPTGFKNISVDNKKHMNFDEIGPLRVNTHYQTVKINLTPLNIIKTCTMDYPKFIALKQKEESISIQRVKEYASPVMD